MIRSFLILFCTLSIILPAQTQDEVVKSEIPHFAIKVNVFPFVIRNADIAIPRLHMGFERRISSRHAILAELGYGSSINGTVFSEYKARDISGNIGIRKYFGFKNSSRKYWILNLTQDYYKHDLRTWVCINDCEYFRRIHHTERTWRTGIMGGMGIVIKLGSRLSLDFDFTVGLYNRYSSTTGIPAELDSEEFRRNNHIQAEGNEILPHFQHRIRLSWDFYGK
ncbi:MAG: hypothetical protein IPI60_17095 [Saprospiraceae bacterium]|nr:hypothetical protein [Saprospiraceae bacterium]